MFKEQVKESESARSALEAILSEKNHSALLEEQKLVNRLNEENERNQNLY
ncbi:hypothetical protein ACH5Y9_08260 [Methylomonas sp. BW4-1]